MDKKELEELDKKYINQMKRIIKNYNKKEVDILDFYPNFNLKPPYTNFNPLSEKNLKPFQLLPFFNGVIVDIKPFKNESDFKRYYGMSTTELLELHQKGCIYFNLFSPYVNFHNLENDYLDCILEKSTGNSCWSNFYYGYVVNNNSFDLADDISSFFKDKSFSFGSNSLNDLGLIDPLTMVAMNIVSGSENPLLPIPNKNYKLFTEKNFTKLWTCGFNEINTFLKRFLEEGNGRLDYAFVFSNIYLNFLCNPILDSLNGTYLVNNQLKELYKDLTMRDFSQTFPKLNKTTPNFEVDESLILNSDVGKILCEEISIPTLMSLENYEDYDYKAPIKALKSLENAVENKKVDEILDLTEVCKNELYSAAKIAEDMQSSVNNRIDLIDKFSMAIGLVGKLGRQINSPDIKPIFDTASILGYTTRLVFKSKMGKSILNKISRFNKSDHILFLYDNYEKFDIHSFNRNPILNRTNNQIKYIPFNDELTDKYKYYEYLYENIPLIRVYIDIFAEKLFIKGYTIEHSDAKVKQYFEDLFERELSISKMKHMIKQSLLYGVAYLSKKNGNILQKEKILK